MSVIANNGFPSGFAGANVPEFESAGQSYQPASQAPASYDDIAPIFRSGARAGAPASYAAYGGYNDGGGLSGFTNIMNGFLNGLQSLLASLSQQFGLGGSGGAMPGSGVGTPSSGGQQYFRNATASSTGDPHETFNATGSDGNNVNGKWDSMTSHSNLLSSDSFDGGYQVATVATQASANGVTRNDSATITTRNGGNTVTMNKDGSYAVSSNGRNVVLQTGQAVQLGNGESVTLGADKSLTETDSNGSGGTIATTLRANGQGGVDVSNTANNVDLGGYLVNRSDDNSVQGGSTLWAQPIDPYAFSQPAASTPQPAWSWESLDNTSNVGAEDGAGQTEIA